MMYYRISNDLTTKIIGSDYPQSWRFTKEYEKEWIILILFTL